MPTVILSDNAPFEVPVLGIFELDSLRPDFLGAFTYPMEVMGKTYQVVYDLDAWDAPPPKPEKPRDECAKGDPEWYAWNDYLLYEAAINHEVKREKQVQKFIESVGQYIAEKCPDANRITTAEDWAKVYEAALVPQLTVEVLAKTLQQTYQAEWDGADVLEALSTLDSDNPGAYNTLRQWENELMVKMQMTEIEYAMLPLAERARKVCSLFLPKIMDALYSHREMQKAKRKNNG